MHRRLSLASWRVVRERSSTVVVGPRNGGTSALVALRWMFPSALALLTILVTSWIVQWVCALSVWSEGVNGLQRLLHRESEYATALATRRGSAPGDLTVFANALCSIDCRGSGIDSVAWDPRTAAPGTIVSSVYPSFGVALSTWMVGTPPLFVRAWILGCLSPILMLFCAIGVAEGCAKRGLRRSCGRRESATFYHHAKHCEVMLVMAMVLSLMAWPADVPWAICVPILVVVVGCVASVRWQLFNR